MAIKRTSVPEQAILFYTRKYIDKNAQNNKVKVVKYTADVSFCYNGQPYVVEYDAYSTHHTRIENDKERDKIFQEAGYKVLRFRDNGLPFLDTCHNIRLVFDNYSQRMLDNANMGLNEYLSYFECKEKIDIRDHLDVIKSMYRNYSE